MNSKFSSENRKFRKSKSNETLTVSSSALGGQRTVESAAAVHVLARLALADRPDAADVSSGDMLPFRGVEPHRNPHHPHHLNLALVRPYFFSSSSLVLFCLSAAAIIALPLLLLLLLRDPVDEVRHRLLPLPLVVGSGLAAVALAGLRRGGPVVVVAAPVGPVVRGAGAGEGAGPGTVEVGRAGAGPGVTGPGEVGSMGPLVPTVAVVAIVSVSPSFPVSVAVSVSLSDSISLSVSVTHGVMRRTAKDFISWLKKRGI